ncbi:MAG: LysM peptidoglycan-binding domain-containing protein [Bacilli bacterium]|nr:LysM peptidoglycan-binding domain-containing protein [Bacilli bacterium]
MPSNTSSDYYFIHRDTGVTEPVIIEYGFLDSPLDDVEQLKNKYEEFAQAVVNAVIEYTTGIPIYSDNQYVVKSGDSLYLIANKFGTTVDAIMKLNNLTTNLLSIGQVLLIPQKETIETEEENVYTVVQGDSLYLIANKFGTTVDAIMKLNNLTTNLLSIGQVLLIPQKETIETEEENVYTVVQGDSLYSIAKKYNTTVDEIKSLNNMTNNLLNIGQRLNVPGQKDYIEYVVMPGDTLYKIAIQNNTTVDEIKRINDLSSNLLNIGQILKI